MNLLTSFYGHFLLTAEETGEPPPFLWLGSWTRFLGLLGYRPEAVRLMLSRACRKGAFVRTRKKRSAYYRPARAVVHEMYLGGYHIYQQEEAPWDGRWLLAFLTIDAPAALRGQIEDYLSFAGFGRLGRSVWLSPYDRRAELEKLIQEFDLVGELIYFQADHASLAPAHLAAEAWEIREIAARYRALIEIIDGIRSGLPPAPSGEEALAAIVEAEVRYGLVAWYDPYLPSSMLPSGWPGRQARAALHRLGDIVNRIAWDFYHGNAVTLHKEW